MSIEEAVEKEESFDGGQTKSTRSAKMGDKVILRALSGKIATFKKVLKNAERYDRINHTIENGVRK